MNPLAQRIIEDELNKKLDEVPPEGRGNAEKRNRIIALGLVLALKNANCLSETAFEYSIKG